MNDNALLLQLAYLRCHDGLRNRVIAPVRGLARRTTEDGVDWSVIARAHNNNTTHQRIV